MADKKKTIGWADLDSIEAAGVKTILLPATSKEAGRDVFVKIRALGPMELVKAYNFPMNEINRMAESGAGPEDYTAAIAEHTATFDLSDLTKTVEATITAGLVEPDPTTGDISKLSRDFDFIFEAITSLTVPTKAANESAAFRDDGERASD